MDKPGKAKSKTRRLLIVDDALIDKMSRDAAFLKEFPILGQAPAQPATGSCGGCAKRRQQAQRREKSARVREVLASLPPEKKRILLDLLDADVVRLHTRDPRGHIVKHTIQRS